MGLIIYKIISLFKHTRGQLAHIHRIAMSAALVEEAMAYEGGGTRWRPHRNISNVTGLKVGDVIRTHTGVSHMSGSKDALRPLERHPTSRRRGHDP